ncbi:hypothetical protein BGZ68_007057 [Mortierella alpina]|nr:hypothetical protein BGZ68_007057 [Mortierella alpina]
MNAQPTISTQARHLVGTAYIVYGPGGATPEFIAESHSSTSSPPPQTTPYFVLRGVPHLWGAYPPDIVKPHGCIPPHLYYSVNVSEYDYERKPHQDRDTNSSVTDTLRHITLDDKNNSDCTSHTQKPLQEWTLPFVHRLGDGHDHAGGLTTAYEMLQDLEGAEDFGDFIKARVTQIKASSLTCPSKTPIIPPSLYASTEVLVSERRMKQMINQHFFRADTMDEVAAALPEALRELRQRVQDLEHSSEYHRIWLAKSDLTLLLPQS